HSPPSPALTDTPFAHLRPDKQLTHRRRIGEQVLLLNYLQYGVGGGAGQVISAKRGSQHAVFGRDGRMDQDPPDREPISHAFGHADDVGLYTGFLMSEKPAGPSVSRLDFIQDHQRPVPAA